MNRITRRHSLRPSGVLLLAALAVAGLLSGCLKQDETPDAETHAAVKAVNDAKAEQSDANQRAKEANDLTSQGK